jgi:hypothetical protein
MSNTSSSKNFITKLMGRNGDLDFGGSALAIFNNRIVVGMYETSSAEGYMDYRGVVYLYGDPNDPQSGRSYSLLAKLTASDGKANDYFGVSAAMNEDIIVVGASASGSSVPGAVYVFRFIHQGSNISISEMAKLTALDGGANDYFGTSISMHGNYILVGASGAVRNDGVAVGSAYLFGNLSNDTNNPEWTQLQKFQPDDLTAEDAFGIDVAMDDNIAVIATADDNANAAYVFAPDYYNETLLSNWSLVTKLTGSTGVYLGSPVAVAGSWIVAGASEADSVFVFTKTSSSSWTQVTRLVATDGGVDDSFGSSLTISKDASTIVVGSSFYDFNSSLTDSGAAYMFQKSNSTTTVTWTQVGKFIAGGQDSYDYVGSTVAMEGDIIVVGAPGDESYRGAVYVLDVKLGFSSLTPVTPNATTAPTVVQVVPNDSSGFSPGVIVGIFAIIVVGGIAALIVILKHRIKIQREAREQQHQEEGMNASNHILPVPPPPSLGNLSYTVTADDGTPRMADVVFVPQGQSNCSGALEADAVCMPHDHSIRSGTLEAEAFLDPMTAAASQATAASNSNTKFLNEDQEMPVQSPGP